MNDKVWGDYDQVALDAAYDAMGSVEDFDAYLRGYAADGARARDTLAGARDLAYGAHKDQVLDVYRAPDQTTPAPVNLFLHGGYWRRLTKDENGFAALALAPAGATVMVNTYSLAPDVHLDVIVRQCREAVAWAYRNAAAHGGDPERLYISGHSAGGHLVGMMLATDWAGDYGLPADVIKGATAISGIYDLRPLRVAHPQEWLELSPAAAERNSPLLNLPVHKCPVIMAYGADDPIGFHEQSDAYAAALRELGVEVSCDVLPGLDHFAAGNVLMDAGNPVTRLISEQMGL
ncbi:MAG TPA: alpha/beta hydrolase [Alphaproteobacteria bacterium]|nr:alpha/beta hydrolase [Alphaproteobacteria bacterium]